MPQLQTTAQGLVFPSDVIESNFVGMFHAGASGVLDAAGERYAVIFQAPKAGTLEALAFRLGTVTSAQDLKVSWQSLDANGVPDGTVDQYTVVAAGGLAANGWITPGAMTHDGTGGGTKRTVTRGEWLCGVIEFDSAVGNLQIAPLAAHPGLFGGGASYGALRTGGTWTKDSNAWPCIGIKYSDGTYGHIPGVWPIKTITMLTAFGSSSSPDEYALRFQLPTDQTLTAVQLSRWDTSGSLATYDVIVYDAADNVLASVTGITETNTASGNVIPMIIRLSADIILTANTTYRIAVRPSVTSTQHEIDTYDFDSAAIMAALPGGASWYLSTRTNAGAWTDATTSRPGGIIPVLSGLGATSYLQRVTQYFLEVLVDGVPGGGAAGSGPTGGGLANDPPPTAGSCTGGGTVAAGSNPSAGTSIVGYTDIVAWIQVTTVGGTIYRWAKTSIPHGGARKAPRVLSFGRWSYGLTDRFGQVEVGAGSIRLADTDYVLRIAHDTGALLGATVEYFVSSVAVLKAGGTAQRHGRGIVKNFRPEDALTYSLDVEDSLFGSANGVLSSDMMVPPLLLGASGANILDQNPTEDLYDKPIPWLFGDLNDGDGTVECKFIASYSFTEIPGNNHVFLIGYNPQKQVQRVQGADISITPPTSRTDVPGSYYGTLIWVPGQTGWPLPNDWWDFGGRRFSVIIFKDGDPIAEAARSRKIPLVIDLCATESVGDRSGTVVSSLPKQLLLFLNNAVAQDATGDWLSIATIHGGGYSLFDTTTFDTVHTFLNSLGYNGAGIVGYYVQKTLRDTIADFCISGGFDFGQNQHGQAIAAVLDTTNAAASAPIFSDRKRGSLIKGSFRLDPKAHVENEIRYVYKRNYLTTLSGLTPTTGDRLPRDPYDGAWHSGLQTLPNTACITALGGRPRGLRQSKVLQYEFCRDEPMAASLASRRLALYGELMGRADVSFDTAIQNVHSLQPGQIIKVTCMQGTGAVGGWVQRRCQLRKVSPDLDKQLATLTATDVDDLLP